MRSFYEFLLVGGSKTFSLGSLFVTGVLVARVTGPTGFGYYNTALTLLLLFDAIVGQPLDTATIRFHSLHGDTPKRTDSALRSVFRVKLLLGFGLVAATCVFAGPPTTLVLDQNPPVGLLTAAAVSGTLLLALRSTSCALQIQQRFRDYAAVDILQGSLRLVGVLLLFGIGIGGPTSYLSIYGVSALISYLVFHIHIRPAYFYAERPERRDLRQLLSYMGMTSLIVVIGTTTGRVDVPLVMTLAGAETAGQYSAAAQIAFLGALVSGYMAVVFQPKVVSLFHQGKLARLIRINLAVTAVASMLCIPFALWILPWFLPALFGEAFTPSVPILQVLLIGSCADLMILPILLPLAIQILARATLIGEITIALLFFALVFLGPEVSALRMAWLMSGVRVAKLIVYLAIVTYRMRVATLVEPSPQEQVIASAPCEKGE